MKLLWCFSSGGFFIMELEWRIFSGTQEEEDKRWLYRHEGCSKGQ
jgi:hypothetical protein